ncbi:hypothetical protein LO771_19875 [Streptacidiphilus sp. ASG 303]|uniref:hypothetical protein n=1 Tax=Streptacidiphilus sp. ASG 303 TaxID=2896847 RepID=UPI001E3528A8|nr:hypothetical protein [Streptacidiphilus sp. ASG 303]MCD0484591.1 hypothetical protein [Streptacidiphilus sp. ASG 303]
MERWVRWCGAAGAAFGAALGWLTLGTGPLLVAIWRSESLAGSRGRVLGSLAWSTAVVAGVAAGIALMAVTFGMMAGRRWPRAHKLVASAAGLVLLSLVGAWLINHLAAVAYTFIPWAKGSLGLVSSWLLLLQGCVLPAVASGWVLRDQGGGAIDPAAAALPGTWTGPGGTDLVFSASGTFTGLGMPTGFLPGLAVGEPVEGIWEVHRDAVGVPCVSLTVPVVGAHSWYLVRLRVDSPGMNGSEWRLTALSSGEMTDSWQLIRRRDDHSLDGGLVVDTSTEWNETAPTEVLER